MGDPIEDFLEWVAGKLPMTEEEPCLELCPVSLHTMLAPEILPTHDLTRWGPIYVGQEESGWNGASAVPLGTEALSFYSATHKAIGI